MILAIPKHEVGRKNR